MAGTATSAFGASRRENHDASDFYDRFTPPEISDDKTVSPAAHVDVIFPKDAASMTDAEVADNSVALVVTSPPYFVGKEYEQDLDAGHVPTTYLEYLDGLRSVLEVCATKLEPGGRIAVNVANLGRKPYRSLAADVIAILQDDLGLLLRGEIIWQKARGATGSCAWGSFQSPVNPVLRDLTERVIVASKGRFDRALTRRQRHKRGLPSEVSISRDDFLEATTDIWEMPAESATRVGHPAPFPVALPQRLIDLYTYRDDLVMDPYMGSGTTAVAAVRTGRHYVGFDVDPAYVRAAERRIEAERRRIAEHDQLALPGVSLPALPVEVAAGESPVDAAARAGLKASEVALALLAEAGFEVTGTSVKVAAGQTVTATATDRDGVEWLFDVVGGFTTTRSGLAKSDVLWRTLGKVAVIAAARPRQRLVLLSTDLPPNGSNAAALDALRGEMLTEALDLGDPATPQVLAEMAGSGPA
jgi:DNA modification methylase